MSPWPGFFIALEGIDGAGKSTLAAGLAAGLRRTGRECTVLQPGDTRLGELVRGYLLQRGHIEVQPWTEALLFNAGRAQLLHERILPALREGQVVIADRYAGSTLAYQGGGRGLPMDSLRRLHREACGDVWPDLTLLMDLPRPLAELRRRSERDDADRFEAEARDFHARVADTFAALAAAEPDRIVRLDAARGAPEVLVEASRVVRSRLAERARLTGRPSSG
jgi:dTMP kinase